METQKLDFFSQKVRILTFDEELKSQYLRQCQSYISNWYINGKVFTSTTHGNQKIWILFQKCPKFKFWPVMKSWNHLSFVDISPTLVIDTSMERSSWVPTTVWKPKNLTLFFKKVQNWIILWLVLTSWNLFIFVNISPSSVIDTSTERSSTVLQHGNPKIWFFSSKKFEIRILTFDEKLKSP